MVIFLIWLYSVGVLFFLFIITLLSCAAAAFSLVTVYSSLLGISQTMNTDIYTSCVYVCAPAQCDKSKYLCIEPIQVLPLICVPCLCKTAKYFQDVIIFQFIIAA